MNDDDDWFKIYNVDQDDSFSVLKILYADIREKNQRSSNGKKVNSSKRKNKRITIEKKKLLDIVVSDLILEYRFALTYLNKIGTLDREKDENTERMLIQLAKCSMSYSVNLQSIIEKLGEESGKITLPYKIKNYDAEKIIRSHIYIEKKILETYKQILIEFKLDNWLREILKFIIEKKSKNLRNLIQCRDIKKAPIEK